ncbi:XFP N-terminal domain protein [Mycobacterium kansasii 732]|nr:XFP N-terminal domain protein [Mycobacterium kansasii 732]
MPNYLATALFVQFSYPGLGAQSLRSGNPGFLEGGQVGLFVLRAFGAVSDNPARRPTGHALAARYRGR